MSLKETLRELARKLGYEVTAYTPLRSHPLRRARLLDDREVDLVLDGGANRGQYAVELRRLGYRGRIVSVEPLPAAFDALRRRAAGDPAWSCVRAALAAAEGELELRAAAIEEVSSALPATGAANTAGWRPVATVRVPATTVDRLAGGARRPFLKLDLQGYECEALKGAAATLEVAAAVEVELSSLALYEGAPSFAEMVGWLDARGFTLFSAEPALVDYESGRVLQWDGLFVR